MAPRLSGGPGKFDLGQKSRINVTPLIGIMLLLLVVFMLAAPKPPRSIGLDIPVGQGWAGPVREPVFVNVMPGKKLYIAATPTSLETLVADLGSAMNESGTGGPYVMVRADRHVPYGDFMTVMNVLKEAGYKPNTIVEDM